MRIASTLSTVSLMLAASVSVAQSYQSEITLDYSKYNLSDSDEKINSWQTSGSYYFSPVDTRNHPLAEAAFLEKSSKVTLHYQRLESEDGFSSSYSDYSFESKSTSDLYGIEVAIFIPNSIFYVAAAITDGKSKYRYKYTQDGVTESFEEEYNRDNTWTAVLGITPVDGLLISSQVYEDVDLSEYWNLNAKYVMSLNNHALNLETNYNNLNNGNYNLSIASDFYFDRTFSAGIGYTWLEDDYFESAKRYDLRVRKFIGEKYNIHAAYSKTDLGSADHDAITLGVGLRF